jgi:YggT family protein
MLQQSCWAAFKRVKDVGTSPFWTHWYYHLPNFVLAALMYTLIGRALLGLIVQPDDSNYIWRAFCRLTDPVVRLVALVTPAGCTGRDLAVRAVWLFWLRVLMLYAFLLAGAAPRLS